MNQNAQALQEFITFKGEFDSLLGRLTTLSDNHFGISPDNINWANVGDLNYYIKELQKISDRAFSEGEHAK
jgi:hypothetical protein